ncbi:MAG: class I SAM-dependent methyltransferase [Opitutaceae bacterium]|nr:class I SAM-dependent methyltransferase [Opitutaceae bacterium]
MNRISSATVRADFNDGLAVLHYARAAHFLGLWKSESLLVERFFPDRAAHLLEAGCGAGRVTLGLWEMGYHQLTAFDFAEELLDQARQLARERGAAGSPEAITFLHADATRLGECNLLGDISREPIPPPVPSVHPGLRDKGVGGGTGFSGALFMFNGLMQIPGRENRRAALRGLHGACRPGAPLLFTTHDRDSSIGERVLWRFEAARWERGEQDPRLPEYGDRYFEDETGRTFMHLPDRAEILADLAATGWTHEFDALRRDIAMESQAVLDFSDECRFWLAKKN